MTISDQTMARRRSMSNGTQQHQTQPEGEKAGYPGMMDHPPAGGIKMHLDLSWRQIAIIFGALWTVIGGAATGGLLFMPAKDSEFQPVRQAVEILRTEQSQNRDALSRLTLAVDNLSGIVERLKDDVPARVIEKVAPRGLGLGAIPKARR